MCGREGEAPGGSRLRCQHAREDSGAVPTPSVLWLCGGHAGPADPPLLGLHPAGRKPHVTHLPSDPCLGTSPRVSPSALGMKPMPFTTVPNTLPSSSTAHPSYHPSSIPRSTPQPLHMLLPSPPMLFSQRIPSCSSFSLTVPQHLREAFVTILSSISILHRGPSLHR